ncbi:MAG TPA: DUF4012 domain-containing protein [Nocardioides sp.]|uniref:DUF4012 domain-containing protein n=1 Tax=Nocardioides sp. TaxID=35761 RepID=UPI002ED834C6
MRFQHPRRLAVGVLAAALVALIGYAGWLLWQAADSLSAAADDAAAVKTAALGDDPTQMAEPLDDFADHAGRAADVTDSPVWSLMTKLPWIGDDARGVRTVSQVADDLARDGLRELTGVVGDIDAVLPADGGVDVAQVQGLVEPVATGHAALVAAREELAREDPSGYVEALKLRYRDLQADVEDAADAMGIAHRALGILPAMLGADGQRNYLLIVQNNAEIRATGGLPGAVSLLTADRGQIELVRQVAGNAFGEAPSPVLPMTAAEEEIFGENLALYFLDANLTPDFARASDLWKARWEQTQPERIDGVVSLDAVTLSYVLRATGPVQVDGIELTADNAVDELLSRVYSRLPDPADQDVFFRNVAASVFAKVTSFAGSKKELLQALRTAAGERRILLHAFDDEVQAQLAGTAVAGEIAGTDPVKPQIGVYFADGTLSKMSYYLRYDTQVQATSCLDGVQTWTGKVTLRSTAPADAKISLPRYVTGSGLPKSSAGLQLVTVYVYAPEGATASDFDDNDLDFDQFTAEIGGRKVIGTWVVLDPGETTDLRWTMTSAADQTGDARLTVTPSIEPGSKSTMVRSAC